MVQTWSWHGPRNKHFINMSLAKRKLSVETFRAWACLEVGLVQMWSLYGSYMVLAWSQNLNTQVTHPVYQVDSVSKLFRVLANWKEKLG